MTDRASRSFPGWVVIPAFVAAAAATAAVLWILRAPPDADAPGSSPSAIAPSASTLPNPTPPSDVLVWAGMAGDDPHAQDVDSVRTYLLSADDSAVRVAGELAGAVLLFQGKAWRWTPVEKKIPPCVCGGTPVAGEGVSVGAELVGIGHADRLPIVVPPDICNADDPPSSVTLLATIGSLLFVRSDHTEYGCGAHGIAVPKFMVWDLDAWEPVDLLHAVDVTRARQQALLQLAPPGDGGAIEAPPSAPDLELVTLQPGYDPEGHLVLQGGFKTWACHACTGATSFVWGQYSRGVLVPIDTLPSALQPFAHAPAPVRWLLANRPSRVVGGWSAPPVGQPIPDAVRQELTAAQP